MLLEEWLKPLGMSQAEFARQSGIPYRQLNAIVRERRGLTVMIALRLSRVLGMSVEFWLNMQQDWDLWHALRSPEGKRIAKLRPLRPSA
jgi:addiction module HigA family antidote